MIKDGLIFKAFKEIPEGARNLWDAPHVLQQKFPAEEFMVTTKVSYKPNSKLENEKGGLVIMGFNYASVGIKSKKDGIYLVYTVAKDVVKGIPETEKVLQKLPAYTAYLRVEVSRGATCRFSYSLDNVRFTEAGELFPAEVARWKGAKVGFFCSRESQTNDSGYAHFNWFRIEPHAGNGEIQASDVKKLMSS